MQTGSGSNKQNFNSAGEILTEGVDYILKYENNTNAGKAGFNNSPKCIVTGIGNYKGSFSKEFTINPKSIETCEVVWDETTQSLTVKDGNKVLEPSVNYYYSNILAKVDSSQQETTRTVTVTAKGNYTGKTEQTYIISNPDYVKPKKEQTITYKLMSGNKELAGSRIDSFMTYTIDGQVDFGNLRIVSSAQTNISYSLLSNVYVSKATINSNGKINILDIGKVYIEIAAAETDEYKSASEIICLNIKSVGSNNNTNNNNTDNTKPEDSENSKPNDNTNDESNNGSVDNESNNNAGSSDNSGNENSGSEQGKTVQKITGKSSYTKTYKKNSHFTLNCKAQTALTYKSSNKKVAMVDKNGKVTIKGAGTCRITVKAVETDKYLSAAKTITIKVTPAKVVIRTVKSAKKKTFTVTWKKVATADGYEIQYSTSKSFKKAKTVRVGKKKVSATIKKLKAGKRYYVRVRAFKTNGKSKRLYGAYSKQKVIRVKK